MSLREKGRREGYPQRETETERGEEMGRAEEERGHVEGLSFIWLWAGPCPYGR